MSITYSALVQWITSGGELLEFFGIVYVLYGLHEQVGLGVGANVIVGV